MKNRLQVLVGAQAQTSPKRSFGQISNCKTAMLKRLVLFLLLSKVSFAQQYVGSFVADGTGNIAQGYVDSGYTISGGYGTETLTGTYCMGTNNIGTLSLVGLGGISTSSSPVTTTFEIVLGASGDGEAIVY